MATNINKLLSKKGWTGEEVGKALIASLINDITHLGQEYEPLFTQKDLTRMVDSLQTERDANIFNFYQNLHTGIVDAYNKGQAQYQQFYNGFYRLLLNLRQCQTAEDALKQQDETPLIMTQSQYDRYYKEAQEKNKTYYSSFYDILFDVLEHFVANPDKAPENIKKAIEATKEEAVTNKDILSSYNRDYGLGYYTLPDGRRSDEMELDEWQKALEELYMQHHKYILNGEEQDYSKTLSHFNTERLLKGYKMFFYGIDSVKEAYKEYYGEDMPEEEEQDYFTALKHFVCTPELEQLYDLKSKAQSPLFSYNNEIIELIEGKLRGYKTEWSYYEEPPADLTKYDLLENAKENYFYYHDGDEGNVEDFEPFIEDYPELYKLMEAYIKKTIPELKKLKKEQYTDNVISWERLAELDIANYKSLFSVDDDDIRQLFFDEDQDNIELYKMRAKSHLNGIAILHNPKSWQVDENGDYKEKSNLLARFTSIDAIDETQKEELNICANKLLKPALRFLFAYNTLLDLLSETYAIEGLEQAKLSTSLFENQLDGYNGFLFMTYCNVYGNDEEQDRKRERLKEVFSPIYPEELQPTEQAKNRVIEELSQIAKVKGSNPRLKDFDYFINILRERGL